MSSAGVPSPASSPEDVGAPVDQHDRVDVEVSDERLVRAARRLDARLVEREHDGMRITAAREKARETALRKVRVPPVGVGFDRVERGPLSLPGASMQGSGTRAATTGRRGSHPAGHGRPLQSTYTRMTRDGHGAKRPVIGPVAAHRVPKYRVTIGDKSVQQNS